VVFFLTRSFGWSSSSLHWKGNGNAALKSDAIREKNLRGNAVGFALRCNSPAGYARFYKRFSVHGFARAGGRDARTLYTKRDLHAGAMEYALDVKRPAWNLAVVRARLPRLRSTMPGEG